MSKSITVKIPTTKVIELLKAKQVQMELDKENYPVLKEKYRAEVAVWEEKCLKIAIKNVGKTLSTEASFGYGATKDTLKVSMHLPSELFPPRPKDESNELGITSYKWEEDYKELQQTIRLLGMHDGEFVSTSTYRNVSRFL
jgi:hypothetical protein